MAFIPKYKKEQQHLILKIETTIPEFKHSNVVGFFYNIYLFYIRGSRTNEDQGYIKVKVKFLLRWDTESISTLSLKLFY